ncbi:MAG: putative nucleic acid-binding protein, contains PIN domain [Chloroflexi bacterium]|nr:MAG: putative nucleic acid-binding protein, contains PIN domain [Chloroflexota bacterium]
MAQSRILFLDASVLVAASRSPSGGSALVIEVCEGQVFRAALSGEVVLEARVNIAKKFGEVELIRFYEQLAAMGAHMAPPLSKVRLVECASIVGDKDAHVLASALECGAEFLLTLDRRHLITPEVQAAGLSTKVLTPGEFLQQMGLES